MRHELNVETTEREQFVDINGMINACLAGAGIRDGSFLDLGTWQGVFLGEFDGPRRRRVNIWVERKNGAPEPG